MTSLVVYLAVKVLGRKLGDCGRKGITRRYGAAHGSPEDQNQVSTPPVQEKQPKFSHRTDSMKKDMIVASTGPDATARSIDNTAPGLEPVSPWTLEAGSSSHRRP